jgi:alpha-L-fucosidase 2
MNFHVCSQEQIWEEQKKHLSQIVGEYTTYVDAEDKHWPDGHKMGNGDLGVVLGTTKDSINYYINKTDFGSSVAGSFWYAGKCMKTIGGLSLKILNIDGEKINSRSNRTSQKLDILNAKINIKQWMGAFIYETEVFTSANENLIVNDFHNKGYEPFILEVRSWTRIAANYVNWPEREYKEPEKDVEQLINGSGIHDGFIYATRRTAKEAKDLDWISKAVIAVKIIGDCEIESFTDDFSYSTYRIKLMPGQNIKIAAVVLGDGGCAVAIPSTEEYIKNACEQLKSIDEKVLEAKKDEHIKWWEDYWKRSYVRTNNYMFDRYYAGAQYQRGCAVRAGKVAPGIFGSFATTDYPWWNSANFYNYNFQTNFDGALSCNMPEFVQPYFAQITADLQNALDYAAAAGYDGVCFARSPFIYSKNQKGWEYLEKAWKPVEKALVKNRSKLWQDQLSVSSYLAVLFAEYYQYTKDTDFLKETAYPFLKLNADFWLDYLQKEHFPNGGFRYVVLESSARELETGGEVDKNPILDLAFIRHTFKSLIEFSKDLDIDKNEVLRWQDVLDHLSEYPTTMFEGVLCFKEAESMKDGQITYLRKEGGILDYDTPALLHLLYPAQVEGISSDPSLLQTARNTIDKVNGWNDTLAFAQLYTMAASCKYDPQVICNQLERVLRMRMRNNLDAWETYHGVQLMSTVQNINSFLLQSYEDILRFFPSWPKDKDARFVNLRAKGAFLVSSSLKNGEVEYIVIHSEKGQRATIQAPWKEKILVIDDSGKIIEFEEKFEKNTHYITYSFDTNPGNAYEITRILT